MSEGHEEYYVGIFHHLEASRQLNHDKLCEALRSANSVSIQGEFWTRILDYQYSLQPLSLIGSLMQGGRFNIGNDLDPSKFPVFPALYIAENYETAYSEVFGELLQSQGEFSGHELALRSPDSFSHVRLETNVSQLFDLTKPGNLDEFVQVIRKFELSKELKELAKKLGLPRPWLINKTKQLHEDVLAMNWRLWPTQFEIPANSQIFGRSLVEAGYEGVIYPSVKGQGNCAAIFPQCFEGLGSSITLADNAPPNLTHNVLDESTYSDLIS